MNFCNYCHGPMVDDGQSGCYCETPDCPSAWPSTSRADAKWAIDILAQEAISRIDVSKFLDWEDWPYVGELDFEAVCKRVAALLEDQRPSSKQLEEAVRILTDRVEQKYHSRSTSRL